MPANHPTERPSGCEQERAFLKGPNQNGRAYIRMHKFFWNPHRFFVKHSGPRAGRGTQRLQPGPRTLLLSFRLDKQFADLFRAVGFRVLWAGNAAETEKMVAQGEPDLAIEWQAGPQDFPVRDLLRKYGRNIPVFCALNWNNRPPAQNPEEVGCAGYLLVPFELEELFALVS